MDLQRMFTEHPASVGETYGQHLVHASYFGGRMVLAGLACMLHALLPFIFVRTGSEAIEQLNARMLARRRQGAAATPSASPEPAVASRLAAQR